MRKTSLFTAVLTLLASAMITTYIAPADKVAAKNVTVPKSLRGTWYHYFKNDKKHPFNVMKFTKHNYSLTGQKTLYGVYNSKGNKKYWHYAYKMHTPSLFMYANDPDGWFMVELVWSDAYQALYKPVKVKRHGKTYRALKEKYYPVDMVHPHYRYWYSHKIK